MLKQFNIKTTNADIDWFNRIYLENHLRHIRLAEGAQDAIVLVKEKGIHCGIISDIDNDYQLRQFQELNLIDTFHSVTTSEEAKSYKPNPPIFEIALNKAGYHGEEALMIGDSYTKDISGGKNMGMTTIWINRYQSHINHKNLADYTVNQFKEIIPILNALL